jgi:hypothetical protein
MTATVKSGGEVFRLRILHPFSTCSFQVLTTIPVYNDRPRRLRQSSVRTAQTPSQSASKHSFLQRRESRNGEM